MNIRSWSVALGVVSMMGLTACVVTSGTGGTGGSGGSGTGGSATGTGGSTGNVGGAGGGTGTGGQGTGGMAACDTCATALTNTDPNTPFCNQASSDLYKAFTDCVCVECANECSVACMGGAQDAACTTCGQTAAQNNCKMAFDNCSNDI